MELILGEEAGRAQDISDIFSSIRLQDPDHVQEITLAITALNNLSWGLRELAGQIDAADRKISRSFANDLDLLQSSVALTLEDVWTILGKIPRNPTGAEYRKAWKEVCQYCVDMGKQNFHIRIDRYKLFIYALCKVLQRQTCNRRQFEHLRHEIVDLRNLQLDNRQLISASEALENLALVPAQPAIRQPRSQERVRPTTLRPTSPTSSHDSYESMQRQAVPSPPGLSPTTTFSTISQTSNSSTEVSTDHWASKVYKNLSSTPLETAPETSRCFGGVLRSGRSWPERHEFEPILKLKFPGGLQTSFHWRRRDYKCKLLCEWVDGKRGQRWSCMSLTDLHVRRKGPFLYFCRPTPEAVNTVWTSLKFTSIEWLIIYHCTFLSLRSHDSTRSLDNRLDHDLYGEKSMFSGAIRDSGYKHALRVYHDRGTGALRLEAAVLEGEMQNTPIWTAFITHRITSPTWFRYIKRSSTVYLAELQRHIFSSEYTPFIAANGEHFLDFELVQDAEDFVKTLEDFGEEYRRMGEKTPK
ncbi:hypothetical protein PV10_02645 [Exophiala mesophila]|uniref:Uncharacterized protein n=1 Tax=Exophiala mesophila TaxID=212818 RepID=A0A0D2A7G8_EXOME|nr:uncharacterized protein PV10_02645 [Exophiala mesophila]KIV94928.1 hypothetical protein PV10_02645 [Exophiala mesophila]